MTIQKWVRVHHCDEDCPNKIAVEALQIELTAAVARIAELEKLLIRFRDKLEVILPKVDSAIVFQSIHGMNYDGPNLAQEMKDVRAALSPKEPATQPEPPR